MMLIWWAISLLGGMLAAGFGCYMWGSHSADKAYDDGYADAEADCREQLDRADRIILRTQELDVPRSQVEREDAATGHNRPLYAASSAEAGPGHTIYAELTPEQLDNGDAGFQYSAWSESYADLMADDWKARGDAFIEADRDDAREFAASVDAYIAGLRAEVPSWLHRHELAVAA